MAKKVILFVIASLLLAGSGYSFDASKRKRKIKGCITHTVGVGESLLSILKSYKVGYSQIEPYNENLEDGVLVGEHIYIPKDAIGVTPVSKISLPSSFEERAEEKKTQTAQTEETDSTKTDNLEQDKTSEEITTPTDYNSTHFAEVEGDWIVAKDFASNKESKEFLTASSAIQVGLILPLSMNERLSKEFTQFYQGFLIALEELKEQNISVNVDVIDSGKDMEVINDIVASGRLENCDIIVGPIFGEQFKYVAQYAAAYQIPIVSPLAKVSLENEYIYEVAPYSDNQYDKLKAELADRQLVLFTTQSDDEEFIAQIDSLSSKEIIKLPFNVKQSASTYNNILQGRYSAYRKENNITYIVAATKDSDAEAIISKIGAMKMFAWNKTVSTITTSKVGRSTIIDPSAFFKANVSFITSYHADRLNIDVAKFDNNFYKMFETFPSLYSYRGYDVATYFVSALKNYGSNFHLFLDDFNPEMLQVEYNFTQSNENGSYRNSEWSLVNYTPSFDIEVK